MSRIAETFAHLRADKRRGFIPFISAGDPTLDATRELIVELARAGATLIEQPAQCFIGGAWNHGVPLGERVETKLMRCV